MSITRTHTHSLVVYAKKDKMHDDVMACRHEA